MGYDIDDTDADANRTTTNWTSLGTLIQTTPLLPAAAPTMFENLPHEFLPFIYSSHTARCTTALEGTPTQPVIPEIAATPALYVYYSQGVQYILQQRLTKTRAPKTQNSTSGDRRGIKGKELDTFDGSNRDLYPAFVLQLTLFFSSNSHRYVDDISKIRAAGSYLRGHALS